jgi:spore coat polysaccharide biosynthesis protein SpsF
MNIIAVVQARTGSTRLPGKILKLVCGKTLFELQMERMQRASTLTDIIVATTLNSKDDKIVDICLANDYRFHRGSYLDLLDRHYKAIKDENVDAIVKIPSDCPLIDPEIIDKVVSFYIQNHQEYDYVSNLHPPTYPDGNDVEVISFNALETAWKSAEMEYEREHTTPYIWDNPELFRIGNVNWETGLNYSESHRFTLDFAEDYLFIKSVFEELYPVNPFFNLSDILNLLEQKPRIKKINKIYNGKFWYKSSQFKFKTMDEILTKIPYNQ